MSQSSRFPFGLLSFAGCRLHAYNRHSDTQSQSILATQSDRCIRVRRPGSVYISLSPSLVLSLLSCSLPSVQSLSLPCLLQVWPNLERVTSAQAFYLLESSSGPRALKRFRTLLHLIYKNDSLTFCHNAFYAVTVMITIIFILTDKL